MLPRKKTAVKMYTLLISPIFLMSSGAMNPVTIARVA